MATSASRVPYQCSCGNWLTCAEEVLSSVPVHTREASIRSWQAFRVFPNRWLTGEGPALVSGAIPGQVVGVLQGKRLSKP